MKCYIGPYHRWWHPHRIILPLKYIFNISDEDWYGKLNPETFERDGVVDRFEKTWIGRWLHRKSYQTHGQTTYIKADRWDAWSADNTMAKIILPILKVYVERNNGVPYTYAVDAPQFGDKDGNDEDRWNWIIGEILFAFEQYNDPDRESQFYSGEIDIVWIDAENGLKQMTRGPNDTFEVDRDAQKAYEDRIQNGLVLFGKYFQNIWV